MAELSKDYLEEQYVKLKKSTLEIAIDLKTYPNKVRRALSKFGIPVRDRGEAQSNVIKKNGGKTPTSGRKRTEEERRNIAQGLGKRWEELPKKEVKALKEKLSASAKKRWKNMTEKEKQEVLGGLNASQRGAKSGTSRIENMIAEELTKRGYSLMRRTKNFTTGAKMEIDIAIQKEKIAIEVDGPTHFKKIYSDEAFAKKQISDKKKDKHIQSIGWRMIRAQDHTTSPSLIAAIRAVDEIENIIKNGNKKLNIVEIK